MAALEEKAKDKISVAGGPKSQRGSGVSRQHMAMEEYAVGWNGPDSPLPRLRLLLLADVDLASAGRIVEWAIQGNSAFDLCIVCGDFIPRSSDAESKAEPAEKLSAEEGEMSATLAQLENTVCRVVYVPGPMDPVLPSVRLQRSGANGRRGAGGASIEQQTATGRAKKAVGAGFNSLFGAEKVQDDEMVPHGPGSEPVQNGNRMEGGRGSEGLLQLTPTSKNVHCRDLRLAPGLSAAGFTEETLSVSTSADAAAVLATTAGPLTNSGNPRITRSDDPLDINRSDSIDMALRALCQGKKKIPNNGRHGNAEVVTGTSGCDFGLIHEAVILLTRLGGPLETEKDGGARNGERHVYVGGGDAADSAEEKQPCRAHRETAKGTIPRKDGESAQQGLEKEKGERATAAVAKGPTLAGLENGGDSRGRGEDVPSAHAMLTAARLRKLWRKSAQQRQRITHEPSGGEGTKASERQLLLHVCSGPGTFLAVRQALDAKSGEATMRSPDGGRPDGCNMSPSTTSSSAHREVKVATGKGRKTGSATAGISCRVGGVTTTALGSLRRHGAYCVVELDLPRPAGSVVESVGNAKGREGREKRVEWSVAGVNFGQIDVPGAGGGSVAGWGVGSRVQMEA